MARAFNGVQLLVLGGAGIGAFYAAAHLAGRSTGDVSAIVAPAPRSDRTGLPATAASQADRSLLPVLRISTEVGSPARAPAASAVVHTERAEAIPGDTGQPFASMSWVAPPPPPPKPVVVVAAPPAPPVAPPLPFTFVGLVEKGTPKPQAFLSKGDELLVVSLGDLLENGTYRVEGVSPSQIVFTHLPTSTKQVINLSGGSQ